MKKRLFSYLFVFILVLTVMPLPIFAKEKLILKTDKSDLEIGDEVVVTAEVSSDMKLYAFMATLSYDKSVFQEMTSENLEPVDNTLDVSYNSTTDKFGFINKTGEISGKLFQVHLKVKKDAHVGSTNIGLTNISASDGNQKMTFDKVSTKVLVTKDASSDEVVPNYQAHQVVEQEEALLTTFTTKPILVVLVISMIILLCSAIYVRTCKKNKKTLWNILVSAFGILFVLFIILLIINNHKKDVNKDGQQTYDDAKEILEYLIDIEGTKQEENKESQSMTSSSTSRNPKTSPKKVASKPSSPSQNHFDYDVNNDGTVDIEDAGGSAGSTTEDIQYKVTLKEKENESVYIAKQDGKAVLYFNGSVSPTEEILKIKINGKYYDAIHNGTTYMVTVDIPKKAGVYTFEVNQVLLSNHREIDSHVKLQKEVLKQAPKVDLFNIDDENHTFNFTLEDKDNAFQEGQVVVLDDQGKEVLKEKIGKNNHFEQTFEEDITYTILVTASYDLDSNTLNQETEENYSENVELYRHTFSIASNYQFTAQDFTITDILEKGAIPKITFSSSNLKNLKVEYIVIDGKEHDVTLNQDDYYEIALTDLNTSQFGKKSLTIEQIVLENLKSFHIHQDYEMEELTYTVLKHAPLITDITLKDNAEEKNITVSYRLQDNDDTLSSLTAILVDSAGKTIDTKKDIEVGKSFTLSYQNSGDGRYKVKFLATYNLGTDRHTYTDKNIGEEEILTQIDIAIQKVSVSTVYPVKNQKKYEVTYEISVSSRFKESHNYNKVSSITINGLNYDANQKTGFTSVVSFTVPSESGIVNLEATRVQLQYEDYNHNQREFFSVQPVITQIDVLKDQPKIEDFRIVKEDYDLKSATFSFTVSDDKGGFTGGEVELAQTTKPIHKGENTVTFENLPQDEELILHFYGDYDLDTNTLKGEATEQNQYKHTLIHEKTYGLYDTKEYDKIVLVNLKTESEKNNTFFEKGEEVPLTFQVEGLNQVHNLDLSSIFVGKEEYPVLKKEDTYQVTLTSYKTAGSKKITIDTITLSNGKTISLKKKAQTELEVLKTPVTIEDFKYQVEEKQIQLHFTLKDDDQTIMGKVENQVQVNIFDEDHNKVFALPYQDTITIDRKDGLLRYYVFVEATYDKDQSSENHENEEEAVLLDEVISLDQNYIELRNIEDITLYQKQDDATTAIEEINVSTLQDHLEDYFVKISMKEMPTVYSKIKKVVNQNGKLVLLLDYQYVTKEKETTNLRIDFGKIQGNIAINENHPETFSELIERIKKNPSGHFMLTHDLDASSISSEDTALINIEFKGTLDGQGYRIQNLKKPLFNSLNGATIENLRFSTVRLSDSNSHGTLANTATSSTIKAVLIDDFTNTAMTTTSGTLLGKVTNHTTIEECKVTNFNINTVWLAQTVGGFVGYIENSIVKNNYIVGSLSASWNFVSGFIGNVQGTSTLENNYAKVNLYNSSATVSCGFACASGNTTVKNNISLNKLSGNITHKFISGYKESSGNAYLKGENDTFTQTGVTTIEAKDVNQALFDKAQFNRTIWNLKNVSYENTPTFNLEKVSSVDVEEVGELYDENEELLYQNLRKLMPFYNNTKIVKSASNISDTHPFRTKEITHIIPVDQENHLVSYLTTASPNKISKIKIIFKDQESLTYSVRYDNTYDMVVSYRIQDLKLDYTFNHYVIDENSTLVNHITTYLEGLTYEDNLDTLTETSDSRLYRDYYNEVTKKNLREFALKFIANSNYTNTISHEGIDNYLEREIKKDQKLEKVLYVYNYLNRFYDVSFEGIKLSDLLLFHGTGFHEKMNPYDIALSFLSDDRNLQTGQTNTTYERMFAKYTTLKNIPELLEYYVTTLTDLEPDRWVAKTFKGYLTEQSVDLNQNIHYTLWDHMKYQDNGYNSNWYNYTLPILTLPENAAYIISTPTQFIIGAQRTYTTNPDDTQEQELLRARIESYASRMKEYYTNAYEILGDVKYLNDINTIQIDKRYTLDANGNTVFQNPYTTEEPFHKNFNEVIGQWAYNDYNAATANGLYIIWRVEGLLDGRLDQGSEYTFHTWSHETAHNMDARLFLKNNSRRFDGGGEDYADGNLTQSFGDGDIVMNLSRNLQGTKSNISANLTPDRIDSPSEIHDFYKKVFETIYIMDYLEGKAFLELSPLEQSKIAVQVSYPNEGKYTGDENHLNYKYTLYQAIDEEQYQNMQLETVDDLYDNQLVIFPSVIYSTYTDNRYGGENIYKAHWYQPHNDYGRPDSYSLKWFAYEMLGYKGYDNGYIEYYSNIHSTENGKYKNYKTDLMALQRITNDTSMTFEKYKKMRFSEVENHLQDIQIIDVDQIFNEFYEALKKDAEYVIAQEKLAWEKYPGNSDAEKNERNKIISAARQFKESANVRRKVYYALKNGTNEFTGLVYDSSKQQTVGPLTITKEAPQGIALKSASAMNIIEQEEEIIQDDTSLEEVVEDQPLKEENKEEKQVEPSNTQNNRQEPLPNEEDKTPPSKQEELSPSKEQSPILEQEEMVSQEEQEKLDQGAKDDSIPLEENDPIENKAPPVPQVVQDTVVEKKKEDKASIDDTPEN